MTTPTLWVPAYDGNNAVRIAFETGQQMGEMIPFSSNVPRFWFFDAPNARAARKRIYPGYKAKSDTNTPKISGAYDFINAVREELLPHCENTFICLLNGFEADDLIASFTKKITEDSSIGVNIISTDGDFFILSGSQCRVQKEPKWAPFVQKQDARLFKTLVGDQSDSIPGWPGFGEAAWQKLSRQVIADWKAWFDNPDSTNDEFPHLEQFTQKQLEKLKLSDLRIYWEVIGFLPVDFNSCMTASKPNLAEYNKTLEKYLWTSRLQPRI